MFDEGLCVTAFTCRYKVLQGTAFGSPFSARTARCVVEKQGDWGELQWKLSFGTLLFRGHLLIFGCVTSIQGTPLSALSRKRVTYVIPLFKGHLSNFKCTVITMLLSQTEQYNSTQCTALVEIQHAISVIAQR